MRGFHVEGECLIEGMRAAGVPAFVRLKVGGCRLRSRLDRWRSIKKPIAFSLPTGLYPTDRSNNASIGIHS